jgi:hypothetical protein
MMMMIMMMEKSATPARTQGCKTAIAEDEKFPKYGIIFEQ